MPGTGPSGASHNWGQTLIFRTTLRDEIQRLKKTTRRPDIKPRVLLKPDNQKSKQQPGKRPGSDKRSKTKDIRIDQDVVLPPSELPPDAVLEGYRDFVVQDLIIKTNNTRYIARLSQIESQMRQQYPYQDRQGMRDFEAVKLARQRHSRPICEEFKSWMEAELSTGRILPKSVIRSGFTYTQNQLQSLVRYRDEGCLSFENNAAERLVKNPAIGRKNYLFVGGIQGGRNAAAFYSLVSSAKANYVEPFAGLRDVFTRLPYHRCGEALGQCEAEKPVASIELDELLTDRWLLTHPEHVWTIDEVRRKERQQKEKRRRRPRPKRR